MKLGFIGCGNMATAIINGIIKNGFIQGCNIYVYDVFSQAIDKIVNSCNVTPCKSEIDVVKNCDTVILAVKPNVLSSVLSKINNELGQKDTLIISIAAGKSIEFIRNNLSHENRIIRVMPNINALVSEAVSAYCGNNKVTQADYDLTDKILSSFGQALKLDESYFPIFGVVGGCSPAMVYMFIDSLARAGVKNGMKKDIALKVAAQAVYGSAKMIIESNEHPWELVDKVCSPGGTTIEAVASLQKDGFEASIITAVDKAIEKDKKL